jgi:protein-L-isoaspartate(D-aspartate) O-methyltransferase
MNKEAIKYARQREEMVEQQIASRGIKDPKVLQALHAVPRHLFVSEALRDQAYGDFGKDDRVLEIGTGSGYQAAVLAEIAYRVYTIERIRPLYIQTRNLLDKLHYHNVVMRCSDGTAGWQDESPFDAIIVTAGAPEVPEKLLDQLAEGGRLVVPVGNQHSQDLIKFTKDKKGIHIKKHRLISGFLQPNHNTEYLN